MAQIIVTATKAEVVPKEKTLVEKLQSTEWRFAKAYIESNFNLAEAARRVFNIGGKGAKKKNLVQCASGMGRHYLNKDETQQYVNELLLDGHGGAGGLLPSTAIKALNKLIESNKTSESMKSQIAWKILELRKVIQPQQQQNVQDHRHIHLQLPPREED